MQGLSLSRRSFFGSSIGETRVTQRASTSAFVVEGAHKKGAGSTKNGRDSISKRRGVKVFGMQKVKAGGIIMRQVGTKFHPGENVGMGRDYTIFAKQEGLVFFERGKKTRRLISVYPNDHPKIVAKLPTPEPRDHPSRRERWRAQHTPRAIKRERARQRALEEAQAVSTNSKPSPE